MEYGEHAQPSEEVINVVDVRVAGSKARDSLQDAPLSGVHGARVVGTETRESVKITLIEQRENVG